MYRARAPLRKIVSKRYWRSLHHPIRAKDSVTCTLECGHTMRFKGSQEPRSKAGCWDCRQLEFYNMHKQENNNNG